VLTVCENGFGKRTAIDEYRLTRRGGKGVINIKATERNGRVVAMKAVSDDDELMLITSAGIMLRTDLSGVREIGRATQGVRLIRVEEGTQVVAAAKIAPEVDAPAAESTETATEGAVRPVDAIDAAEVPEDEAEVPEDEAELPEDEAEVPEDEAENAADEEAEDDAGVEDDEL
jgi:DNA gyrase subunit A